MSNTNLKDKKELASYQITELFNILKDRFEKNRSRHPGIEWKQVKANLEINSEKLWSLYEMERTGGEPDIIELDKNSEKFIFCDCSPESPIGRRNICYDQDSLESRKENKPKDNAIDMATRMGIEILTEEQYRKLQTHGIFDTKTSSWIQTPSEIRKLGGALFADRRYNHVFVYHNGASSYYAVRGFRGCLIV